MHTNREIKEYGHAQLQLESALIQINAIKEGIQLDEIVNKLIAVEQKIDSFETESKAIPESVLSDIRESKNLGPSFDVEPTPPPQNPPKPEPAAPDDSPATPDFSSEATERSLDELPAIWEEVRSRLPLLLSRGVFENAVPMADGEDRIKIACPHASFSLADDEAKQNVTKIFTEVIGKPVQIELVKEDVVPQEDTTESSEKEVKTTPMMRRRQAEEDEKIRPVLDLFDARIIETQ